MGGRGVSDSAPPGALAVDEPRRLPISAACTAMAKRTNPSEGGATVELDARRRFGWHRRVPRSAVVEA